MKKSKCDIKNEIYYRGTNLRRYVGTKKGDPEFNCCWGYKMWLDKYQIKVKEVVK